MAIETFQSQVNLPGLSLPVRATLVREGGKAVLISPCRFSPEEFAAIRAKGAVTDIVAPTLLHHLYVAATAREFPGATLWGVAGFEKKRPDIAWGRRLTRVEWPHSGFLQVLELRGVPGMNEAVFFHAASRTLIVADLCFNLLHPRGWAAGLTLRILGTYGRFAVSRLLGWTFLKDRAAFIASMGELMKWDFDRIIMSHGDVVETGGKALLEGALRGRGLL